MDWFGRPVFGLSLCSVGFSRATAGEVKLAAREARPLPLFENEAHDGTGRAKCWFRKFRPGPQQPIVSGWPQYRRGRRGSGVVDRFGRISAEGPQVLRNQPRPNFDTDLQLPQHRQEGLKNPSRVPR